MKWTKSICKSVLHKAIRRGDADMAGYAAAMLIQTHKEWHAVWRRLAALPSEDFGGVYAAKVATLYQLFEIGKEHDNTFLAIIYLCSINNQQLREDLEEYWESAKNSSSPGLFRHADELKNLSYLRIQDEELPIPSYAFDHHTGHRQSQEKWWRQVNAQTEIPSPWNEELMNRVLNGDAKQE